jgi:hypothetical protein
MCSITLTILHEKRMRRSVLCVVCCLSGCTVFFNDYKKKVMEPKYVLFYSLILLSETFPILIPTEHYVNNVHKSSCTVLLF